MEINVRIAPEKVKVIFKEQENEYLKQVITDLLSERDSDGESLESEILNLISSSMESDGGGGAIDVDGLSLEDVSFDYKTKKGKLYLTYVYSRFYGCDDISNNDWNDETMNFEIDKKSYLLKLYYFELPVREPDNY